MILLVYVSSLVSTPALRQPGQLILFTLLFLLHIALHFSWMVKKFFTSRIWYILYFIIQGLLIFAISVMNELNGFTIGLYMGMAGVAVGILWPNRIGTILSGLYFFTLSSLNTILEWGWREYLNTLPLFALMFLFVYTYVIAFLRQEAARERTQALLKDLEDAHQKLSEYATRVEELTIAEERQRMARELHDTLAQGLAGLIMQLEAVDSYMDNENTGQAQVVTQQAMQSARTTLADARRAIQNLRTSAQEKEKLSNVLGREVDQFTKNSGISTTYEFAAKEEDIPATFAADIHRILQEALRNISRHANAKHVLVRLETGDGKLKLSIKDDGHGFDVQEALEKPGRFGLGGMQERARKLGGDLTFESTVDIGTAIQLEGAI
jgi:NarL family two-component system sensor histidine kinase YdfH